MDLLDFLSTKLKIMVWVDLKCFAGFTATIEYSHLATYCDAIAWMSLLRFFGRDNSCGDHLRQLLFSLLLVRLRALV